MLTVSNFLQLLYFRHWECTRWRGSSKKRESSIRLPPNPNPSGEENGEGAKGLSEQKILTRKIPRRNHLPNRTMSPNLSLFPVVSIPLVA